MNVEFLLPLLIVSGFGFGRSGENEPKNRLIIHADSGRATISRHLYGQFSEHLGRGYSSLAASSVPAELQYLSHRYAPFIGN